MRTFHQGRRGFTRSKASVPPSAGEGKAPATTEWTQLPGIVQHGFTHFRLELALLAGTTAEPIAGIWARPADFKDYALPTLTKKLVNYSLSVLAR